MFCAKSKQTLYILYRTAQFMYFFPASPTAINVAVKHRAVIKTSTNQSAICLNTLQIINDFRLNRNQTYMNDRKTLLRCLTSSSNFSCHFYCRHFLIAMSTVKITLKLHIIYSTIRWPTNSDFLFSFNWPIFPEITLDQAKDSKIQGTGNHEVRFFAGWIPFQSSNQQCQKSSEGSTQYKQT